MNDVWLDPVTDLGYSYVYYSAESWYGSDGWITPLDDQCLPRKQDKDECQAVLDWVRAGKQPNIIPAEGWKWLVARTDSSMLWGRYENDCWRFPPACFRRFCGAVESNDSIREIRLFGPKQEIFLWQHDRQISGGLLLSR